MKYRKKPMIVDAFKWTGGQDKPEYPEWFIEAIKKKELFFNYQETPDELLVLNIGSEFAELGHYIVMDEYGAMSPYSSKGFEATYEKVEENV